MEIIFLHGRHRAGETIDIEDYEFKFDKINKDKLRSEISRVVSIAIIIRKHFKISRKWKKYKKLQIRIIFLLYNFINIFKGEYI